MPFNGSGTYSPPSPPTFPAVAGTKIRASYFNSVVNDIATALSNCVARDGQSTVTGTMNLLDVNVTGDVLVTGDVIVAGRSVVTSRWATGEYVFSASPTAPSGTVSPNGGTIGNSSSSATTRANSDTEALFTLLWDSTTNTQLQLKTSAGVNTARGASAAADFAANRQLSLPNLADGETLIAAVSSAVSSKSAGEVISHTHTFTGNPVPDHFHTISPRDQETSTGGLAAGGGASYSDVITAGGGGHTPSGTNSNTGGAINKAAGVFVKVYIAL